MSGTTFVLWHPSRLSMGRINVSLHGVSKDQIYRYCYVPLVCCVNTHMKWNKNPPKLVITVKP